MWMDLNTARGWEIVRGTTARRMVCQIVHFLSASFTQVANCGKSRCRAASQEHVCESDRKCVLAAVVLCAKSVVVKR